MGGAFIIHGRFWNWQMTVVYVENELNQTKLLSYLQGFYGFFSSFFCLTPINHSESSLLLTSSPDLCLLHLWRYFLSHFSKYVSDSRWHLLLSVSFLLLLEFKLVPPPLFFLTKMLFCHSRIMDHPINRAFFKTQSNKNCVFLTCTCGNLW